MGRARVGARRSWPVYVGSSLVVVGLCLLGYVGWEYFGTNIVSHHKQQQIVQQTERAWRQTRHVSLGARATPDAVDLHGAQALIRIPRFGKDYVVPVLPGVSEAVLAEGFGHFKGTAMPGQRGNYALAGHRITHGEPLRNMPELRPGDKVVVETRFMTYTYVLDTNPNNLVVSFTNVWVLSPHPHDPVPGGVQPSGSKRLITLTTCSELFHTDNRMIAFGHLVAKRPNGPG